MEISANSSPNCCSASPARRPAIIQGLENEMAGVRSGRIIPALQNVAHLRDHRKPTLTDLPVRVLLGTLGRQVPDAAGVVRDLERLPRRQQTSLEILRLGAGSSAPASRAARRGLPSPRGR